MVQSRRKVKTVKSKTGIELETVYCRKCMQNLKPSEFFTSVDEILDSNGYFSICKSCCNKIYDNYNRVEHDMAHSILKTCRKINLKFDERAVEAARLHIQTLFDNGKETDNVIGIYKSKIAANSKDNFADSVSAMDLTFIEPTQALPAARPLDISDIGADELKRKWGDNYNREDYEYLERELSEWTKTHKNDTKAETTLLKELCYKSLEIKKEREGNKSTAALVKELQELMKTASVDPAKTASIGSGRSQDTFSGFIKTIEETEPADYFKDKELFKDFDNIGWYFKKYITRPLKNFITQSRDFNVEKEDDEDDDELNAIIEEIKSGG